MAEKKLTKTRIERLIKPGIYSDGAGLFLRIRVGGSKSWHFIYKRSGKRTEIALGPYPGFSTQPVSLELAREKAQEIRDQLARGQPIDGIKDERPTFEKIMEEVITVKTASAKNEKHKAQWAMTLRTYAKPLHMKFIADITIDDVFEALKPIWTEKPETANRTRMRIESVFENAMARKIFTGDNPARWKGGLKELLPAQSKLSRGNHEAVAYEKIPAVMAKLRAATGVSARASELTCLTACRSGEVRGAVWPEFDLAGALWVIPKERMKAGVEHRVPLSDRAVELLKERQQVATGDLVFEGESEGRPISDTAMVKAIRLASGGNETIHGFRSSFRDWAGDETHHPREVMEHALAHGLSDKTEAAYRRSDALKKRRALMDEWATYCGSSPAV
ncbi:tyrosine-type recombinase/integrase [Rhizobium rhizogenes]|uniref:Integrase n=1 Tax=Rhizobium rhizogenes NBRC 13257 TaxID=1220581 RepID=A0AA87UC40_RHIRH|nr:site-specific integrase [Rhizobium rhizogenes]NTG60417.1 integrase arm-type DNA-binding domain-containing protein [Rhizobium rhizogenes]NTG66967.1 integrase arm-type DNA-binding domain-containing protein [Rhizobium rhizogenes]NTG79939.1 integrase arm-type DNA-binding domain-containing protein [Rhizobium rhizogenes]NTH95620.1 integrase arm-type DNA-binding domain-containing protein [Rhizobium rhizogenes]NTI67831.1 integrase arm-type DNA-binding domain-containing protein [Rhizobium rhizogenes